MASWYDLNGALLRIDADDEELEKPLLIYLEDLRTSPRSEPPAFTFAISRGEPRAEPAAARLICEGPLPEAPVARLSVAGDTRWFIIPDRISLEHSIADRLARIHAAPGHESLIGGTAAIHAIYAALLATGQTLVHAAALRLPRRDNAIVIFAPSGAGKTTTSLALALQGFGLMADDATVLAGHGVRGAEKTFVWGLPRPPKVHRRTAEMLPEIGRLVGDKWNKDGEQGLAHSALRSVVEFMPGRVFPLAALVLLGSRVTGAHLLRPIPKADVLVHFASDNVSRLPDGVGTEDLARYHTFVSLVQATPAYELNVGSDLSTLGETIAATLGANQAILSA